MDEKANVHHGMTAEQLIVARNKKKADLKQEEIDELKKCLSIRERLERKLHTDVVTLELDDDLGKFSLQFRKLAPVEHEEMVKINREFQENANDPEKTKSSAEALYVILGKISIDGLDAGFWRAGTGYSPDILLAAIIKVMAASKIPDEKYLGDLQFFRGK